MFASSSIHKSLRVGFFGQWLNPKIENQPSCIGHMYGYMTAQHVIDASNFNPWIARVSKMHYNDYTLQCFKAHIKFSFPNYQTLLEKPC